MNLTAYVHDLDPVIWQVTDSIALRWYGCLLYTSDAADDLLCGDLGWRRIIKKKKKDKKIKKKKKKKKRKDE